MVDAGADRASGRLAAALLPGTPVEVRTRFDDTWSPGFEVVDQDDDGYRLRRLSDQSLLPVPIPTADVRRARKRETWWV